MSIHLLLRDRCTIMRATTATDLGGGETRLWQTVADDVPCRIDHPSGGEQVGDDGAITAVTRQTLYLHVGTDIGLTDRAMVGGAEYEVTATPVRTGEQVIEVHLAQVQP